MTHFSGTVYVLLKYTFYRRWLRLTTFLAKTVWSSFFHSVEQI